MPRVRYLGFIVSDLIAFLFFSDVSMAPDNSGLIYAVGSDKTIKQFKESQATKEIDLHTITLSTVVLSHEGTMLFTGSTTGTVYRLEQ